MKVVVQVKLTPPPEVATALGATLHAVNGAANWLSIRAQGREDDRDRTRKALQPFAYAELKARGLSAQPALHVIRKVADAYSARKANLKAGNYGKEDSGRYQRIANTPVRFRPDAAHSYDDRCLSWQYDQQTVSIWTTTGRIRGVPFLCSPGALKTLTEHRKGETDLIHRDGAWYLIATCEIPAADTNTQPDGWIGVDLGIANIATTSDKGEPFAGEKLNKYRRRMSRIRAELQARGTKSAKRKLRKRARREARHATHVNHVISKRIVTEAERTGRGIGLEDLTGIRERVRLCKPQRVALHSWAFAQLAAFVKYKAERAGVPFVQVDPAYTSQMCSWCGHTEKANRPTRELFACRSCGVVAHADHNAGRNIAARAEHVWAAANQPHAADTSGALAASAAL
ncbi:RNA-guided endonuclease TnpB family protein [Streptomyces sp. ISL-11]|uniref:RNA-guided endonuclease InsQ/TnpB family protein n=1 Tax=Streptomyces sp. ISL-11 TaxID=2819174 RepID=UPI001BE76BBB|nr:RNA-guided endonuclease TnpB family protein [Streptomyces sp. ISL-11]MBT2384608.1 transposase [Streptomyces sp. ISL-11]